MDTTACDDGHTGFSVIHSAAAYSTLAGVVAGVLFTGVVLLVGTSNSDSDGEKRRKRALLVMVPTFVSLLICSFLFGAVSGEQVCGRAEVEVYAVGSLLAAAGVGTLQAITWMLASLEGDHRALMDIVAVTRLVVAMFGLAQLGVTTNDFLARYGNPFGPRVLVLVVLGIGLLMMIGFGWAYFRHAEFERVGPEVGSWAALSIIVPAVAFFDVAANTSENLWQRSSVPVIAVIAIPTLAIFYLAAVVLQLLGNPGRPARTAPSPLPTPLPTPSPAPPPAPSPTPSPTP